MHVSGNISQGGDGAQMKIWAYNSFAGTWGEYQIKDPQSDKNYITPTLTASHETPRVYYRFDIEGAERIAVQCTDAVANGDTKIYVYLGVNSF
jgi:hypothetical protein